MVNTNTTTKTGMASTNPVANVTKQGTQTPAGIVNFNPNTGARLTPGQSVTVNPDGNTYGSTPQSTTTLSSDKTTAINNIQNKQTQLGQTGIQTDPNTGIATYANGTVVQSPADNTPPAPTINGTTSTGGYNGNIYVKPGDTIPKDENGNPVTLTPTNPQDDAFNNMINSMKSTSDAIGASQLDNIQTSYAQLIQQQEQANTSAAAGTTAYLVGAGRGVSSSDAVLQGTISYGLQQIATLNTQKNADIIKAQQAIADNDFKYASAIQDRIDKTTALQQTAYDKVQDNILQANKDALAQKQQQFENAEKLKSDNLEIQKFDLQKSTTALDNKLKTAQIAKIYSDMSTTDISGAANWVTEIKSGTAKLSDVPKNLKNAVIAGLANGGSSQTDLLQTTKSSLDALKTMIDDNKGFHSAVGAPNLITHPLNFGELLFTGHQGAPLAGSSAADFDAKLKQTVNDVVLPNLTILHGLGRVTDREFQALQSSITSLSPNLSEGEFKREFDSIYKTVNDKIEANPIGVTPSATPPAKDPNNPLGI